MKKLFAGAKYLVKVTTHTLRYWSRKIFFTLRNIRTRTNSASAFVSRADIVEQKISIVFHAYHLELAEQIFVWIREFVGKSSLPVSLIVTTTEETVDEIRRLAKAACDQSEVVALENHGRDIWPFLQVCQSGKLSTSALVLKIHTKAPRRIAGGVILNSTSVHDLLDASLIDGLIQQSNKNRFFVSTFKRYIGKTASWGQNVSLYFSVIRKIGLKTLPIKLRFPAGTIFWTTGSFTSMLAELSISRDDFKGEPSPDDGATEHVLERLFGMLAKDVGGVIPLEKLVTGGSHENRNLRNERDST